MDRGEKHVNELDLIWIPTAAACATQR